MAGRAALRLGKRLTGKSKDEVNAEMLEGRRSALQSSRRTQAAARDEGGPGPSLLEAAVPEQFGAPTAKR